MKNQKRNNILLVLGATVGLFLLNNILLGFIIPKLPGGSATGITTMFVITWLSLKMKRVGVFPVVFLIYGLMGLPSHLAVGDNAYLLAILFLIIPSTIFDFLLKLEQYKLSAYIWAFPLFLLLIKFSTQYLIFLNSGEWVLPNLQESSLALLMGYAGIGAAYILYRNQQINKTVKH